MIRASLVALVLSLVPPVASSHYHAPPDVDHAVHRYFGDGALGRKALRVSRCESRWRRTALSPAGYMGLFQFDWTTWRANGGRGSPRWASAMEQVRVTYRTWRRRGWQPWPVCGQA